MKHLLIIGARGWGREVYAGAIGTKAYRDGEYDVKGFLDSKADAFEGLKGTFPPIICAPEDYEIQPDDVFFVAMGDPQWRRYYVEMMQAKGAEFISIIDDQAYVNPTATIGKGSLIGRWSIVSDNVQVGDFVSIHGFVTMGHDVKINDYAAVEAYCFFGGYSELGEGSVMHVRSNLTPHKKVGRNAVVGSNSVVIRNVPDNQHVLGYPAIKIEY